MYSYFTRINTHPSLPLYQLTVGLSLNIGVALMSAAAGAVEGPQFQKRREDALSEQPNSRKYRVGSATFRCSRSACPRDYSRKHCLARLEKDADEVESGDWVVRERSRDWQRHWEHAYGWVVANTQTCLQLPCDIPLTHSAFL